MIGAGLAGSCLARQLKLAHPELAIAVIEAKTEFDSWVGESTIEVFVDYAHRHLGLGPYLAKHHVIKQALRYYWDAEDKSLSVPEMSEFGVNGYHGQLSYQLDRATLDRDLCDLNREIGVDVFLGTRVLSRASDTPITIDRDAGHTVQTSAGTFRCRWLVDAAGRNSPLARTLGLGGADPRHPIGGYWARYRGVRNIDALGDAAWRQRTAYSLRFLATNHFMYRDYWIWLIPLSEDTVSVGVKFDSSRKSLRLKGADDLTAFLREHRCLSDILGDSPQAEDFYGLRHVARHASKLYSTDRWFLTGMSGLFADAFLSTGCAFLAIANRLIGEMIQSDRAGDHERFERQTVGFERYIKGLYNSIRLTNDHRLFGSYDVMGPFRRAGQLSYHNVLVPTGMEDLKTLVESVDEGTGPADDGAGSFSLARRRIALEYLDMVESAGTYYDMNKGEYLDGAVPEAVKKKYHLPRDLERERAFLEDAWVEMFQTYASRASAMRGQHFDAEAFARFIDRDWTAGQTLEECLNALAPPLEIAAGQ
ncbi:MAG: hypothetical protein AAF721_03765 [Myxococcota bacterium]